MFSSKKYLELYSEYMFEDTIKQILTIDLPKWIEVNGYDLFFQQDIYVTTKKNAKAQNEVYFHKLISPIIHQLLLEYGFNSKDITIIHEAENAKGRTKIDIWIKYGIIGNVVIELKRFSNNDIKTKQNALDYTQKLKNYKGFTKASQIFLYLIKDQKNNVDFKTFLSEKKNLMPDVEILGIDLFNINT